MVNFLNSTRFANFAFIEIESNKLLAKLSAENYLKNLDKQTFSQRAAYYLGELNVFRDSNGRTLRFFITQLAAQNGWQINWQFISNEQMINASIQAYHR